MYKGEPLEYADNRCLWPTIMDRTERHQNVVIRDKHDVLHDTVFHAYMPRLMLSTDGFV